MVGPATEGAGPSDDDRKPGQPAERAPIGADDDATEGTGVAVPDRPVAARTRAQPDAAAAGAGVGGGVGDAAAAGNQDVGATGSEDAATGGGSRVDAMADVGATGGVGATGQAGAGTEDDAGVGKGASTEIAPGGAVFGVGIPDGVPTELAAADGDKGADGVRIVPGRALTTGASGGGVGTGAVKGADGVRIFPGKAVTTGASGGGVWTGTGADATPPGGVPVDSAWSSPAAT
jgi:hypothetical protein